MKNHSLPLALGLLLALQTTRAQDVKLVLPIGHTNSLTYAEFSPASASDPAGGKMIVTTSYDGTAKVWEAKSGKLLHTLTGHNDEIRSARFSPVCPDDPSGGKYIVTASADNTAKVWETKTGKLLHTLTGHKESVISAWFSPDGRYIATGSNDETAKIWEIKSAQLLHTLKGLPGNVHTVRFSPVSAEDPIGGKYIITQSSKEYTKIWEAKSGQLLQTLTDHNSWISSARFSPDAKNIVTASSDSTAKISEVKSGKTLFTLKGHTDYLTGAEFSPDGRYVVTGSGDKTAKIWDAKGGKLLQTLTGHTDYLTSAKFSPVNPSDPVGGKYIVTVSYDRSVKIWETKSSKPLYTIEFPDGVTSAEFSPDGKYFITAPYNTEAKIWETKTGRLLTTLTGQTDYVWFVEFSPDRKYIVTASHDKTAKIWDSNSGQLLHSLTGHTGYLKSVEFSPANSGDPAGGKYIVTASGDQTAKVWETSGGKLLHTLAGHTGEMALAQFSPDGKFIVTASDDKTAKIWSTNNGQLLHSLIGHEEDIISVRFSPPCLGDPAGGKYIVTESRNRIIKIWESENGKLLPPFADHDEGTYSAEFSPDGKYIVTVSDDDRDRTAEIWEIKSMQLARTLKGEKNFSFFRFSPDGKYFVNATDKVWEVKSGQPFNTLAGHKGLVNSAKFSPACPQDPGGGKYIVATSNDGTTKVWKSKTGQLLYTLEQDFVYSADFSPDGRYIASMSNNLAKVWSVADGRLLHTIIKAKNKALPVKFSLDGKYLIILSGDKKITLWDTQTGKEHLTFVIIGSSDWIVTHPSGLFDATPGAMDKLYFVQGLDVIDFTQLKARYYEPGLWKKVIGGEKLRNVVGMKSIELPPDIRVGQVDDKGYLPIELTNKGGGIGEVTVLINGKEAIADARPKGVDSKLPTLAFKIYIGNHKALVKGTENFIAIKAWNSGHWVVSRGTVVSHRPNGNETAYKPAIHIITSGVSDYTGTELDLKYASKDAEDVSKALQLGAKKLFGTEKSFIYNLTTSQSTDDYPTKANILKTFETVSSVAHPLDVVVVYLSGHGINHGGQEGDWHYLTQDAYTANSTAYNDPEIRRTSTLSSNELIELFKKVPALKQVLIIDACASGKVVENLMAKKDIESTTLRALDRMRDRTGLHIITGCTADAVSYEASKYGQGVLTYSLLEGIRGAALRDDQFVDINKLFQYAHERVPTLAEGIGGIQTPQVFSPQGGQSFDIGQLTDQEKKDIPIAKIRPVYIRSTFLDDDQLEDALQLGKKVDESLNEAASKGTGASLIFVDVREYPEGCKLSGRYKQEGGTIKLKLRKKCEGKDETLDISGKSVEEVRNKIISSL